MLPTHTFNRQGSAEKNYGSDAPEKQFGQHGALVLRKAFEPELIEKVANAFAEKYQSLSKSELVKRDALVGDRRYMISVDIKKPFNEPELYANSNLMPLLEKLLSAHLRIASFGVVVAMPGADDQAIHLDHPPLFGNAELNNELPPYAITVVVPLVNITKDVGPTAIWPGTHKSSDRIEQLQKLMTCPDYSAASMPETERGDAYMMDYRVIHGGLANNSDIPRPILYLVYSRPWFRDGFNFSSQPSVAISKKQRKKVPERWQGLFRG